MLEMDMTNGDNELPIPEIEKQTARALLRERFLRLISNLSGQDCRLTMYDCTTYSSKVRRFSSDFENVIVENLITPYPQVITNAIIRINDVVSMHFEVENLSNCK